MCAVCFKIIWRCVGSRWVHRWNKMNHDSIIIEAGWWVQRKSLYFFSQLLYIFKTFHYEFLKLKRKTQIHIHKTRTKKNYLRRPLITLRTSAKLLNKTKRPTWPDWISSYHSCCGLLIFINIVLFAVLWIWRDLYISTLHLMFPLPGPLFS